ncbi:phospholipase A1 VesT1.02-like [Culicoides brevitarsis]|uniref:phospholipase A1 VesT1.02-like n=1 Tax=Culicoides brevitarsis TaxID=469753 RepID=UPI00307B7E10
MRLLVCVILIVCVKSIQGDRYRKRMANFWWPFGCFVYGVPVSDEPTDRVQFEDEELSQVNFMLFTKTSTSELMLDDDQSFVSSNFDSNLPVRILIHGWQNNRTDTMIQVIKDAFLERKNKGYNIIGVDWGVYAKDLNYPIVALQIVPQIGFRVARFITSLVQKQKVPLRNIQLIGHSLGAQVAGFAGQYLIESKLGKLSVIVGLDPALPFFEDTPANRHLDVTDAKYVEVIHTAAGCKGMNSQIGTADFYPNYSRWQHKQPGCGIDPFWQCSHGRAYYYFAESVLSDGAFESVRCKDFEEMYNEKCDKSNGIGRMGGHNLRNKDLEGIYYLKTNDKSPFSLN